MCMTTHRKQRGPKTCSRRLSDARLRPWPFPWVWPRSLSAAPQNTANPYISRPGCPWSLALSGLSR
jgi:hypothetical protein